jgi:hypothetical protein
MYLHKRLIESLRHALLASVVALLTGVPAWAEAAQPAPSRFEPTMEDYLGVYDALQNYRFGVEKHDHQALQSAFWPDGVNIAVPNPGQEIRMPLDGSAPQAPAGAPGPNGGPPPGANAGPPPGGGSGGEVWHLPLDSYIHFDSPTRATHFEYFLSIYPQPERKADGQGVGFSQTRTSIVGWPGHYEDILEKRHGEWRILKRKSMINQK